MQSIALSSSLVLCVCTRVREYRPGGITLPLTYHKLKVIGFLEVILNVSERCVIIIRLACAHIYI